MRRFNLKNNAQKFLLSNFFEQCAILFGFAAYLLLIGGGFILSCIICIATLEFFFPNVIHILNYRVSEKTFTTLYENKHYHAAIYLAELDSTLLGLNNITIELADSYASVGRFTQAEHLYNQLFEYASDTTVAESENSKALVYTARVMVAQSLFKLYERTGDWVGQQEMYAYLKEAYDNPLFIQGTQYLRDTTEVKIWNRTYSVDMRQLLRYDLCRGLRKEQPTAARDSLFSFIQTIYPQSHINPNLQLAYLNTYIQFSITRILGNRLNTEASSLPSLKDFSGSNSPRLSKNVFFCSSICCRIVLMSSIVTAFVGSSWKCARTTFNRAYTSVPESI